MNKSLRIVIAEDENELLVDLEETLHEFGHDVVAKVTNGSVLVEQCREKRPDLVITDIKMPGMDGLEAAAEPITPKGSLSPATKAESRPSSDLADALDEALVRGRVLHDGVATRNRGLRLLLASRRHFGRSLRGTQFHGISNPSWPCCDSLRAAKRQPSFVRTYSSS